MRRVLPLIAVLLLGFAPAPLPKPNKKSDLDNLMGEWAQVSYTDHGKKETVHPGEYGARIKGGKFTFLKDNKATAAWNFSLDPAQNPKTIDLKMGDALIIGIYRFDRDILTICLNKGVGVRNRPKDFIGRQGVDVAVYKRNKQ